VVAAARVLLPARTVVSLACPVACALPAVPEERERRPGAASLADRFTIAVPSP
jgi:hypothetical protein